MPLRTEVFTTLLDRFGRKSIVGMNLDDIRKARTSVAPAVRPFTWITGPVFRDIAREDAGFPRVTGNRCRCASTGRSGHPNRLR